MKNNSDIKLLIALAGNQRLPHLEEEIFSDEEATTIYLHNLCRELGWYEQNDTNACLVYYYASREIIGAWPAAECIMNDGGHCSWLANYKSRFNMVEKY